MMYVYKAIGIISFVVWLVVMFSFFWKLDEDSDKDDLDFTGLSTLGKLFKEKGPVTAIGLILWLIMSFVFFQAPAIIDAFKN